MRYIQEYTDEFLFIEQSCNSPFATEEVLNEIEQHSKEIVGIFERGIKEGVLKQTSPILLISFCYYPIQQIFKEYRKPNSMLPDTDFNMVFQNVLGRESNGKRLHHKGAFFSPLK